MKTQLIWAMFPQGFKNSPAFFKKALVADLLNCVLLQYVDDLLLASKR